MVVLGIVYSVPTVGTKMLSVSSSKTILFMTKTDAVIIGVCRTPNVTSIKTWPKIIQIIQLFCAQ